MKRLFWFGLGFAAGAFGYQRLVAKVQRDGVLVTLTQAQAWLAPKLTVLFEQLNRGGKNNGIG